MKQGERRIEVANVVVVPCDTTSPEEVIAIMVNQVEPQEERGLGTTRWPEDTPEPAETGKMSHISRGRARLTYLALSLRNENQRRHSLSI